MLAHIQKYLFEKKSQNGIPFSAILLYLSDFFSVFGIYILDVCKKVPLYLKNIVPNRQIHSYRYLSMYAKFAFDFQYLHL